MKTTFTPNEIQGLCCHLGALQAIEFVEFARSLDKLTDQQKKLMMRGWLALEHLPKDASLERSDLLTVLTELRRSWDTIRQLNVRGDCDEVTLRQK